MFIFFSAKRKNFLTFRDVPKLGCYILVSEPGFRKNFGNVGSELV